MLSIANEVGVIMDGKRGDVWVSFEQGFQDKFCVNNIKDQTCAYISLTNTTVRVSDHDCFPVMIAHVLLARFAIVSNEIRIQGWVTFLEACCDLLTTDGVECILDVF